MKRKWRYFCAMAAVATGAFVAGGVWAGGVPSTGALTYSGTLQKADDTPLSGAHSVQVNFWNSATPGTNALCQSTSNPVSLDASGRFSLSLPDTCASAVKSTPDIWQEVLVDDKSLGTVKLGTVPYALESGHAVAADTASNAMHADTASNATRADSASTSEAATGALQMTLKGLSTAITVVDTINMTTADTNVAGVQDCLTALPGQSTPQLPIVCTIAASRKCVSAGYNNGYFVGDAPPGGASRSIVCFK
jgi:hypothetical protein